ncbi:transmembrane protein 200A [Lates japonicus]|uniref:Transmembrane protein 200A n=1 Tax=Lates japonicus TaxID=270547 RepID=A0AAD3NIR6_LATJO|nr:transmembrane protein 200A [Lates japonicus]
MGIGMATLGDWPHSETMPLAKSTTGGGSAGGAKTSSTGEGNAAKVSVMDGDVANSSASHSVQGTPSKHTGGALTRFLEQHRHSDRMKMFGPFTMGIGIIFFCANAILDENRDRETKIIHMRDMYSTVIDIHRLRQREQKQHHHRNSAYAREVGDLRAFGADNAARLGSNSLLAFSPRVGGSAGGGGGSAEEVVLLGDEEFYGHGEQAKLDL